MATPKGGSAIEGGLITRLTTGVRFALSGQSATDFFGPGQPLAPAAQVETHGRQFDYETNFNIGTRPRGSEPIDFPTLRALAEHYDLVRLAIETRKDQMGKLKWTVNNKDTGQQDDTAKKIEAFLQEPDGEHDFLDWSRMLLEDLLVIDAPTVYIRSTLGGDVFALEPIDGATIKRVLDPRGRTPAAPDVAYQQIIKGLPVTDYHLDELIYKPRNPRVHKVYGFSPVEQMLVIVNIGLRRQAHQLAFYTAGNIPDMIMAAPAAWTTEQIKAFQKYWDTMMSGDLEARRKMRMVPGDLKPMALRPESSLFDQFDEWIARVICYCFSLPPNAFVKQQNRATAESAQEAALEEGLSPLMEWQVRFMNRIIRKAWKTTQYVFAWLDEQDVDPLIQAQVDHIYVTDGVRLPNEIRDDHGWEQNPVLDERKLAPPVAPTVPGESTAPKGDEPKAEEPPKPEATAEKFAAPILAKLDEMSKAEGARVVETEQRALFAALAEMRDAIDALQKQAPETPIPTVAQFADALASMVEHGVPLNKALKQVGFDFEVAGGDTPLVNAKLVPLSAALSIGEEPAPQPIPVEKRAEPVPVTVTMPDIKVNLTLEQKGGGARTLTMTKANGETVTADVKPGPSTITMVKPDGETVSADITEE
jgi:hypothetical protein